MTCLPILQAGVVMFNETTTMQHGVVNVQPLFMVHSNIGLQRPSVQSLGLLRELPEDQCAGILSCASLRRFATGEFLFMQGESVRNLILLQSGIVKHTQASSDGKEVLLRISSCGDVLNAHGKLASRFHTCSTRAMKRGEALVWEYGRIENLCTKYPQLRTTLDRFLVNQLEELEERFHQIATETVARRLALLLIRLCNQVGRRSIHGLRISITREELAQMTGTTVYTISRLLVRWAQQGLLMAHRQTIVVNDTNKLASVKDVEVFRRRNFPACVTPVPWPERDLERLSPDFP